MKRQVNIGDRYRDSGMSWIEWRVERIFRDPIGLPHAVLRSVQDPTASRTIACPTLLDRRRFWRVEDDVPPRAVGAFGLARPVGPAQSMGADIEVAA